MDILIKDLWTEDNINDFYNILISYKNSDKIDWEKNIVNTNMDVLAIPSPILRNISKFIFKGNYISFLDLIPHRYYEDTLIYAFLISLIKDFKTQKKYINKLSKYIDNWATVDALKFNIKDEEKLYLNYSKELIKSNKPFTRRIGSRILFSFVNNHIYIDEIFNILNSFKDEEHYYVNMVNAWLLCELFINERDNTLNYLKHHNLNKFTINKAISKCRDSFRVSDEDKELLLKYKVK